MFQISYNCDSRTEFFNNIGYDQHLSGGTLAGPLSSIDSTERAHRRDWNRRPDAGHRRRVPTYSSFAPNCSRKTSSPFSLLRADSRQHVRRILWPRARRSATMGVLKSVEPTGFLAFAPAFAGTNWADVNRRIIQNCPHGGGRALSLVPALPA